MVAALGPLTRIRAKAEIPGGVALAAIVSFSKAMEDKSFQKRRSVARLESGWRWKVEVEGGKMGGVQAKALWLS
jgi:hypothetical protein